MWIIRRLMLFFGWLVMFLMGYVLFSQLTGKLIEQGRAISNEK